MVGQKRQIIQVGGNFEQLPNTELFINKTDLKDDDIIILHVNLNIMDLDIDTVAQIHKQYCQMFPNNTIITDVGVDNIEIKEK